ncbi:exported hypothetical protein [Paraburkholderia tropica]|nr:exported hypothetical protein [Paraburkholderia tropica]
MPVSIVSQIFLRMFSLALCWSASIATARCGKGGHRFPEGKSKSRDFACTVLMGPVSNHRFFQKYGLNLLNVKFLE